MIVTTRQLEGQGTAKHLRMHSTGLTPENDPPQTSTVPRLRNSVRRVITYNLTAEECATVSLVLLLFDPS